MRVMLLCVLLCAPLWAEKVWVGKPAPKFTAAGTLINAYEFGRTHADFEGDVIVVLEWNVRDLDSCKHMDKLQERWAKHGAKGLWVFAVHRLKENVRQVAKVVRKRGWGFCVAMGSFYDDDNDFSRYHHDDHVFRVTVIGIDGKAVYYDKTGFETALDAELKKLVYPGLGRHSVNARVSRTAKYFGERKFGHAISEAQKLLAANPAQEVVDDAELVVSRARALARKRNERIEEWVADKRYDLALPVLETMVDEFKGHEIGAEARTRLKAIEGDKSLKPELAAYAALKKLNEESDSLADDKMVEALRKFAADNAGRRAGGVAAQMAKELQADLDKRQGQ